MMERLFLGRKMTTKDEEIKDLCINGLMNDGVDHKQWYLEEILKVLGVNLEELRDELLKEDYDWEEGTPP
jgi:hypothetical protein